MIPAGKKSIMICRIGTVFRRNNDRNANENKDKFKATIVMQTVSLDYCYCLDTLTCCKDIPKIGNNDIVQSITIAVDVHIILHFLRIHRYESISLEPLNISLSLPSYLLFDTYTGTVCILLSCCFYYNVHL